MRINQYDVYKNFFRFTAPLFVIYAFFLILKIPETHDITVPSYFRVISLIIALFAGVIYYSAPLLFKMNKKAYEKMQTRSLDTKRIISEYLVIAVVVVVACTALYFIL